LGDRSGCGKIHYQLAGKFTEPPSRECFSVHLAITMPLEGHHVSLGQLPFFIAW